MKRYRVTTLLTISVSTVVEANDADTAREIALDRGVCALGRTGAEDENEEWLHSGELDGSPDEDHMTVEEEPA